MIIRKIEMADNEAIAGIVREVMTEFKADPKTTVLGDPRLLTMYQNYQEERAVYYVAENEGRIVGGAGIKQLDGAPEEICELQRMFLLPAARGKGIGKALMKLCLEAAKHFGYSKVYLESLSNMHDARTLYKNFGFREVDSFMGDTGHKGCDVKMLLEL